MRFQPKTEAEIAHEIEERKAKSQPWKRGRYDCEIRYAQEGRSSKGNEMITLDVDVFNEHGECRNLKAYLTEANLFGAAKAFGLLDKYNTGELRDDDFRGLTGSAQVGIEKGARAPDGGYYPDKNKIQFFVEPEARLGPAKTAEDLSDEIPF